jgi:hypothetical protein
LPDDVGKSTTQVFTGGHSQACDKMLAQIKDALSKGSIYEIIGEMNRKAFDRIYFPR